MTQPTESLAVAAESRTATGKQVKALRRAGLLPAVVYGSKQESTSISLNEHDFALIYKTAGGNTLLDLSIDGKKAQKVLVHDAQLHPPTGRLLHVDFFQVNMKEKLTTEIPLEFTGESAAVENLDGTLSVNKDSLEVECLPQDLVHEIAVDLSALATFEDVIRVSDLKVPATLTVLTDPEEIIASVIEPRSDEELAELEETPEEEIPAESEEGAEGEGESSEQKEESPDKE